jgi:hypothetical protein
MTRIVVTMRMKQWSSFMMKLLLTEDNEAEANEEIKFCKKVSLYTPGLSFASKFNRS